MEGVKVMGKTEWYNLFDSSKEPSFKDIENYIDNELWKEINTFIQKTYEVKPELSYSGCSGQPRLECKI